ncbi:MAG: hypothetical protein ABR591_14240 [Candidatus Velthaea sp.]
MRFLSLIAALVLLSAAVADAEPTRHVQRFLTHAAFFSLESKQANLLDPQVFVTDPSSAAGTGPQGIVHMAGVRPAFAVDDPDVRLVNAQGMPLGFTLGQWLSARGRASISPLADGKTTMAYVLSGLVPGGVYSFFENHFASDGVTFTPLDGSAQHNTFTATALGTASGSVSIPGAVTRSEGILLVYHSDRAAHGMTRGQIGIDAHHQLIIRVP